MKGERTLLSNKEDEIGELKQEIELLNDEIDTIIELLEKKGILANQHTLMVSYSNVDG